MKNLAAILAAVLLSPLLLLAQQSENQLKDAEKQLQKTRKEMRKLQRRMAAEQEEMLHRLEAELPALQDEIDLQLDQIEIPDIDMDLHALEDMHIAIPDIKIGHIDIPDIEIGHIEIPDIEIDIPDIDIDNEVFAGLEAGLNALESMEVHINGGNFYWNQGPRARHLFRDLSEKDELRLAALRRIDKRDGEKGLQALKKAALNDASPAIRHTAVSKLAQFLTDGRVVPLLGKIANNDDNLTVRKAAIYLLGRSGDKRAVEILQGLVK